MAEHRGTVAVIGSGSWGTALSIVLADAGWQVKLWARRPEVAEAISRDRRNPDYLSEFLLPDSVAATSNLPEAVAGAKLVVLAVPSDGVAPVSRELAECIDQHQSVVNAAKGLEHRTGRLLSAVIAESLGSRGKVAVAVLSGPNLAPEVAARVATAAVAASAAPDLAITIQSAFSNPFFRVYTNPDMLGVELGGALKNVIAIAAGACGGLGFGENTKAALLTRGLAEITRLGVAMGARADTFRGLSGLGDLAATCASSKSRNYRVGFELAQGRRLSHILADMKQVAEGVETSRAVRRLARQSNVEMPISEAVYSVLFEGVCPKEAVRSLMTRTWREEFES